MMKSRLLALLPAFLLLPSAPARGQEAAPLVSTHALMAGAGSARQLDTYLSPMEYSGWQYTLMRETQRMTRLAGRRVSHQSLAHLLFSHTENPAGNATGLGAMLGYDAAWHYHWTPLPRLRLMAGPMAGLMAGAVWHMRNGNNPVQAHLHLELSASLSAIYELRLGSYPIRLRYQADVPLIGCMFAPQYGQSYYDISQQGAGGCFVASHPGNAPALRQTLTADFPLGPVSLRAGYLCQLRHTAVHGTDFHHISHSLLLGVVRRFSLIRHKDKAAQNAIL